MILIFAFHIFHHNFSINYFTTLQILTGCLPAASHLPSLVHSRRALLSRPPRLLLSSSLQVFPLSFPSCPYCQVFLSLSCIININTVIIVLLYPQHITENSPHPRPQASDSPCAGAESKKFSDHLAILARARGGGEGQDPHHHLDLKLRELAHHGQSEGQVDPTLWTTN